ncbi:A/G-specific adenine glycosylase [Flavihumibacter profundi]|jgi:A/G-specific adenine glycosylase|uniref:A/G-specific adenine glycosylase n=1 Tax=Flavihumibacter profundi TaxID=2716883 RepID=UPI001CC82086|nr:A/G-specific adenine glycosylase [Flavihumibacter profundi]MBZ5858650.1 A/G-specific adenine glycosylase [Flavihumibacter profundi]
MQPDFTKLLMDWNIAGNTRQMPWKGERDPYRIWLSEIMLQQTRVEQGLAYYQRFIDNFPTITDLAMAADETVFKLWEGLGYYSRCRNLLVTARFIAFDLGGVFPDTYEDILKLKGIGTYTAAAIASFAFGHPFAVLDGNVFRVISRYFGISTPIDTTDGKKLYNQLANTLLDFTQPGKYNQSIMDFGAVICKPRQPLCDSCVLRHECEALKHGWVNELPVKSKKIQRKTRYFYYFVLSFKDHFYINKRSGSDIWKDLHEWLLLESADEIAPDEAILTEVLNTILSSFSGRIVSISEPELQHLTHQTIKGRFIRVHLKKALQPDKGLQLVAKKDLKKLAFPKFINAYLEAHPL